MNEDAYTLCDKNHILQKTPLVCMKIKLMFVVGLKEKILSTINRL